MEILELKGGMTKLKNSLEGCKSRFELTKESVNLKVDWKRFYNINRREGRK